MDVRYPPGAVCLNWQNCSLEVPSGSDRLVGWIPESPGRGTLSLLWTCVLTIFLCTWVVTHPRIEKRESFRRLHKVALFLKALAAPELIAVESAQEWSQARRVMERCNSLSTVFMDDVQAFYLGMLGMRYRTSQGTKVVWPTQFAWLLEQDLLQWNSVNKWNFSHASIKDRSKADGVAKVIAVVQVGWFVIQSMVRIALKLPLAPVESMTLGYIPLFALTYFFWWRKPKDVMTPSEIELPPMSQEQMQSFEALSISENFDDEGEFRQPSMWLVWYLTPRVFEKEARDARVQQAVEHAEEYIRLSRRLGLPTIRRAGPLSDKAGEEITISHWDPDLYRSKMWPVACLFGMSFPALHLISWDGSFPTIAEAWLWRGAAIVSVVSLFIFMHCERVVVNWRNPSTYFKVLWPVLYLVSRLVILVEAFAAFRAANPAIYETFVVSNYCLHLT